MPRVRKVSVDTPGGGVPKRTRRNSARTQTSQLDDSGEDDVISIPKVCSFCSSNSIQIHTGIYTI